MIRRVVPDAGALSAALAGRVDGIERDLGELRGDVQALGRGLADLTGQLRRLASLDGMPAVGPTSTTDAADGEDDGGRGGHDAALVLEDAGEEGQRDWLTVSDPLVAQ